MLKVCGYVFLGLTATLCVAEDAGNSDAAAHSVVISRNPSSVYGEEGLDSPQQSTVYEPTVGPQSHAPSAPLGKYPAHPSQNVSIEDNFSSAEFYENGLSFLRQGDVDKAYVYFKLAANKGNLDAMIYTASMDIEKKRYAEAYSWYQQLFNYKDDPRCVAIAANALGLMWEKGQVPNQPKDLAIAKELFDLAVEYGLPAAKYNFERLSGGEK